MPTRIFGGRGNYEVIMEQDETNEGESQFWIWWMSEERWWNTDWDTYVPPEPIDTLDEEDDPKGPDDYDFYFDINIHFG
jgi:hypothetical protein